MPGLRGSCPPKFEATAILEVYQDDAGTWDVAMFDSRYAYWHTIWLHCREHGIEFEEARKAFLRGELKEFIFWKGTLETVAA